MFSAVSCSLSLLTLYVLIVLVDCSPLTLALLLAIELTRVLVEMFVQLKPTTRAQNEVAVLKVLPIIFKMLPVPIIPEIM